jgi:hypothetical protein
VNPNGSGISLGHPIGATGAVITVKALYELQPVNDRYALVTMLHRRRAGHRGGFRKHGPRLRQLRASATFEKDRHRRYAMARGRPFSQYRQPTIDVSKLEGGIDAFTWVVPKIGDCALTEGIERCAD